MVANVEVKDVPVVLTIAGSDSGGGAGIQADLKTFSNRSVFGTSVITCSTAQNPDGVISVQALDASHVQDQIRQVLSYFDVKAIKTGMMFNDVLVDAVVDVLKENREIPIIVDPVMIATSGAELLKKEAQAVMVKRLFPLSLLITPNLDEAEVLAGVRASDVASMKALAVSLSKQFGKAVLLKGGHLQAEDLMTDILCLPGGIIHEFRSTKVEGVNSHGSGCSLASAIAAEVAKGNRLYHAVGVAHQFLQHAFQSPITLNQKTQFLNHF